MPEWATAITGWLREHPALVWWVVVVSIAVFVASLLSVPLLVARIPVDYFAKRRRPRVRLAERRHPIVRVALLAAKNIAGVLLVLAGVAMLFVPGQGLITILVGAMLVDFPGKFAMERWLIRRGMVLRSINWLRAKRDAPPLEIGD